MTFESRPCVGKNSCRLIRSQICTKFAQQKRGFSSIRERPWFRWCSPRDFRERFEATSVTSPSRSQSGEKPQKNPKIPPGDGWFSVMGLLPLVMLHWNMDPFKTRWWFQLFFMFTPIWGRFPFWRSYFQMGWFNHQPKNDGFLYNRLPLPSLWDVYGIDMQKHIYFYPIQCPLNQWDFQCWSRWWFETFVIFTPTWGRLISMLTNIFQVGWFNHQLVIFNADLLLSQWFGLVIMTNEIVRADVRTLETRRNDKILGVL